jgi:L-glutamine-phosphate cytidylyltransferase
LILKHSNPNNKRVTTALLLAAGTGSRLLPLTQNAPKCLTIVNGISILERLISNLNLHGFKRLVVVTGHLEKNIRDFLGNQIGDIKIDYIFSPLYKTTNNIYSLWMARKIINESFLLLESDIVFDESLLNAMLYPDRIAVAKMKTWMNGTCVTINKSQQVKVFYAGSKAKSFGETRYKTVNIYSISLTSWRRIIKLLDKRIAAGKVNDYYETVFAEMVADGSLSFKNVSFDAKPWYEIDTIADLAKAERLFSYDNYKTNKTATLSYTNFLLKKMINTIISPQKTTKKITGLVNVAR